MLSRMPAKKKTTDPTFQKAYAELEQIAEAFESQELDLEKSLQSFERGLALAKVCKEKLAELEVRMKEIQERAAV